MESAVTTGRSASIRDGMLRREVLAPPIAVLAAGLALLAGALLFRSRAEDGFHRLSADHRKWAQAVSAAGEERKNEASIVRTMGVIAARAGDEGNLRSVFDPIISPPRGSGVETKSVSYKVVGARGGDRIYEIRFAASGSYPEVGRFLARLETGRPVFVVDAVSLKKGEKASVIADVTLRVPVR